RHRDHALDGGGDILARGGAPPRIRTRATVAEHAPRDDERILVLGPKFREPLEVVRKVELGVDVRLLPGCADIGVAALCAEQEPDRLGEDRLAGPRLAGDRVQAGRELELGLANEHEVLDVEPPEHAAIVDPPPDAAYSLFRT